MPDTVTPNPSVTPTPNPSDAPEVVVTNVTAGQTQTVGSDAPAPTDDGSPMGTPGVPVMPEGGSEKYWNDGVYNWEAHAREQAWQKDQTPAPDATDQTPAPDAPAPDADADAAAAAEAAGVDFTAFNAHVAEHREPSAEDIAKLEAAGIPEDVVRDYVNMKIEGADRHIAAVTDYFGGEDAIANIKAHLGKNYTEAEVAAFDTQLADPGTWRVTAAFLLADAGLPQGGRGLIKGPNARQAPSTSGENFGSEAEFNVAMRDPRYKTDSQYRTRVQNALRNSPALMGGSSQHTL